MSDLTPRQSEILTMIGAHVQAEGGPPTRAEIAAHFGFRSPNAAEAHLRALARKGAIDLVPGSARGIRIRGGGSATRTRPDNLLPIVGRVAAGSPILAEEHIEARFDVDPGFFRPRADYLLRVQGESMRDAGILDGDLLAVHRTREAPQNGAIVVARIEGEVTVKRFEQRGHRVRLLPENPAFRPIEIDLHRETLAIEGLGVGVLRQSMGSAPC